MPEDRPPRFAAADGQFASVHCAPKQGELGYISVQESARLEMARRAEYSARPEVVAKRLREKARDEPVAAEKAAKLKLRTTDYPWLTDPDWVDRQKVRPFKVR